MRDLLGAHHELIRAEKEKQAAIVARDGKKLKAATEAQTQELYVIELLESRRIQYSRQFFKNEKNYIDEKEIRLEAILSSENISAQEKKELTRYRDALKAALAELKRLSEINAQMLVDSRDLFKAMISSLTSKDSIATLGNPTLATATRPVLIDANC